MAEQKKQTTVRVTYQETSALFASQFIVNATGEDLTVGFSSGPLTDPASGETVLPVHTRLAMTREGAARLRDILARVLDQPAGEGEGPRAAQARLPGMKQ